MKRVAILISGSGSNMVRLIEDMQAGDHPAQPVLVASNDPAAAGLAKAAALGVPTKYPGLRTHARAIEAGDEEAGATVHEVTSDLDSGPILGQARVPVEPGDTPETLAARVLEREHQLYPLILRRFAAGARECFDI